jgi:hypothetical protein
MDVTSVGLTAQPDAGIIMEILGYDVLTCDGQPPGEIVDAVKSKAVDLQNTTPPENAFSISLPGGTECRQFLGHGINVRRA